MNIQTHRLLNESVAISTATSDIFARSISNRNNRLKRIFDIVVSGTALLILAPFMIFIALLIWWQDKGLPFYGQERIGLHGNRFKCLKFRSMIANSDDVLANLLETDPIAAANWAEYHKLKDDPRITAVGQFLRKSSLDELPQLWNVLKGDMSLVGPRPIVNAEISKYGEFFGYYLSTRPGLTGLWQVSGRNETTYDERVQFDVHYARTANFMADMKIILATFPEMISSDGAY